MHSSSSRSSRPLRIDSGIFLISFAILLVELLLTRIFSVTMFYHFSFLTVSLAMLGLGGSGMLVTLWPQRFSAESLPRTAATAALVFAVSTVLAVEFAFHVPIRLQPTFQNWRNAAFIFGVTAVPFLAGGLVVAQILTHHAARANRLYCLDLLGAGLACLAFIPMTDYIGAPTAILFAAAVGATAGVVLAHPASPERRRACAIGAAVFTLAGVFNLGTGFYDIRTAKGKSQPETLFVGWNSFSRVEVRGTEEDLVRERAPVSFGYSTKVGNRTSREVHLLYDADAMTQITGFDGNLDNLEHLHFDVTAAPYILRPNTNVLVIGSGGGRDVLTALSLGSGPVTGVEVNPLAIALMRGPFREFSGSLYVGYPGVRIVHGDGRNFVRQSRDRYDLIQASLVDTWAASSAGAYALSENSLYTVEAFEDFFDKLSRHGLISFSRWHGPESVRLVALAAEALRRRGVSSPAGHVIVVRTPGKIGQKALATILVRRSPFPSEETARLRSWAREMEFTIPYAPDGATDAQIEPDFARVLGPDSEKFIAGASDNLSLVTDNRPFFFERVSPLAWLRHRLGLPSPPYAAGALTVGGQTLLTSVLVTLVFTVLLVGAPYVRAWLGSAPSSSAPDEELSSIRVALWLLYFIGLGFGYIVVEIAALQRFNLYLGNPAYSLSVVLFTMLTASGLGSLFAGRLCRRTPLVTLLAPVCGAAILYAVALPRCIEATLGTPTGVRVAVAVATTAPVAFLMGMPFPTGLRVVGALSKSLVSWAWAVNGGASVFGSALAVLVSISFGFSATSWTGVGAYVVALAAVTALGRAATRPQVSAPA